MYKPNRHTEPAQAPWMRHLEKLLRSYGFVMLFILICYGLYYRVHVQTAEDMQRLQQLHQHLLREKELAHQLQAELTLYWQSADEPKWRELLLMRELGLVPKGYTKIVFKEEPSSTTD